MSRKSWELGDKITFKKNWINSKHIGKISRPHVIWDLKGSKCQETLKRLMEVGQVLLEIREVPSGRLY